MKDQLSFEQDPDYEVEQIFGTIGDPFPVILQATTGGCIVQAPADVEYRAYRYEGGETVVVLRFAR